MDEELFTAEKSEKEIIAAFESGDNSAPYKSYAAKKLRLTLLMFVPVLVVPIVLGVLLITVLNGGKDDTALGALLVAAAVLVVPLSVFLNRRAVKKQISTNKSYFDGGSRTVFYGDDFETSIASDATSSNHRAAYGSLFGAEEYGDLFCLFTSNATVLIMSKSDLVQGSTEDLSRKLAEVLGKKFKCRVKKSEKIR